MSKLKSLPKVLVQDLYLIKKEATKKQDTLSLRNLGKKYPELFDQNFFHDCLQKYLIAKSD